MHNQFPQDAPIVVFAEEDIAQLYDRWSQQSPLMLNYSYYSTLQEIATEGIPGKTFLEVGCGPCHIGMKLVELGAAKVFGLDTDPKMLKLAENNL